MTAALGLRGFNDQGFIAPGGATNRALVGSGDGLAWAFQPYSTEPITHLGFRYGARTGTPPTYLIRLEGLDTSGNPDGSDIGGGSATAVTFTPPADTTIDGLWQWKTLTNAYTPTKGQFLASVIRYSSGSVDASNNSSFTQTLGTLPNGRVLPYTLDNLAAAWVKRTAWPVFGWRTASGRYGWTYQSTYTTATANTAGHRSGMHFTVPSGHGSSYRIRGLHFVGDLGVTGSSTVVAIWSTDGTVRQTVTIDTDQLGTSPANSNQINPIIFTDALYDFAYGTKYYCGIEVVSGAVGMNGFVLAEDADRSAFPNGTNRGLVTWNGSSWTETDTVLPMCELILEDVTVPSGGSGGAGQSALVGGIRQ
jgi:hypothetical protein